MRKPFFHKQAEGKSTPATSQLAVNDLFRDKSTEIEMDIVLLQSKVVTNTIG